MVGLLPMNHGNCFMVYLLKLSLMAEGWLSFGATEPTNNLDLDVLKHSGLSPLPEQGSTPSKKTDAVTLKPCSKFFLC